MGKTYLKRLTTLIISFGIILSLLTIVDINKIHAEGGKEENTYATETLSDTAIFTRIDENGNIVEVDDDELNESGIIHESRSGFRTTVPSKDVLKEKGVVNFRTKNSGDNTLYTEADTGRSGYTNGTYAADAAYLGHNADRSKVKFMLAGVIGWVDADEVQVLDFSSSAVQTLSKYYVENGRLYHGIVTNMKKSGYSSTLDCGPAPSYLKEREEYYSYDGHYFYAYNKTNGYSTMLNDYRKDTRKNSVNPNTPYYNYYQFLPQRSQSVYTSDELNRAIDNLSTSSEKSSGRKSKLKGLGQVFVDNQNKYGVNAMTTLGISANESAWGTSKIAHEKNNLFGHAAYDSDPNGSANKYSTPAFSVYYHTSTFMSKEYSNPSNWKYHGNYLGDKASGANLKYASDPFWGEKAASFAWKIDTYLGGKDSYKYTIGIKNRYNYQFKSADIKNEANSSSKTLYSANKSGILSNYAFINLNNSVSNGFYKIQSDANLNENRNEIVTKDTYLFSHNYAYISSSDVTIVSKGHNSTSNNDDVFKFKKGDVNCDGFINSRDLLKLEKYLVNKNANPLTDLEKSLANVNGDENINSSDLLKLEKHLVFYTPL